MYLDLRDIQMQKDPEAVQAMVNDASYEEDFERIKDTYLNPTDGRVDKVIYDVVQEYKRKDPYFLMSPILKTAVIQCWMEVQRDHKNPVLKRWSKRKYDALSSLPEHVQQTFYNLVSAKLNYPNENRQYSSARGGLRLQQAYDEALSRFFNALKLHDKRRTY